MNHAEVADVFRRYGPSYRDAHKLPLTHLRTMHAIEICRTATLGGHVDECEECGHLKISYNSCRNRHCPKCQFLRKEKWVEARGKELLPIEYFHVVFTLPDELNPLALRNKEVPLPREGHVPIVQREVPRLSQESVREKGTLIRRGRVHGLLAQALREGV